MGRLDSSDSSFYHITSSVPNKIMRILPWILIGIFVVVAVVFIVLIVMKKTSSCKGGSDVTCEGNVCTCTKDCKCTAGQNATCKNNECTCVSPSAPDCTAGDNVTCDQNGECNISTDWTGNCPAKCDLGELCPRCFSGKTDSYDPRRTGDTCYAPLTMAQSNADVTEFDAACTCDVYKPNGLQPSGTFACVKNNEWSYTKTDTQLECTKTS